MPVSLLSAALTGLEASIISVEVDSGGDFGPMKIVGLPDTAAAEARERVRSVLRNSGLEYPRRRITVNLAPAGLKKRGPIYDLPIAVAVLALKNRLVFDHERDLFVGELSLEGKTKAMRGILAIMIEAKRRGIKRVFLPRPNEAEARLSEGVEIIPVGSLSELAGFLAGKISSLETTSGKGRESGERKKEEEGVAADLSLIRGQEKAKRALKIMAAGGHNLLLCGPPGSGKTMLSRAAAGIMPEAEKDEALEIISIYSLAGLTADPGLRPFRSPHHSASACSILGGGPSLQAGEISLAHRGLLFLDELPEFKRDVIESLRQPLEEGKIRIGRAAGTESFPAAFTLIAAMNPCPCGFYGDLERGCSCTAGQIERYRKKISGPILDRIDLFAELSRFDWKKEASGRGLRQKNGESSAEAKLSVSRARKIQAARYAGFDIKTNSQAGNAAITELGRFRAESLELAGKAAGKLHLSLRSYYKLLKVARTIADLDGKAEVSAAEIAEALQYRTEAGGPWNK